MQRNDWTPISRLFECQFQQLNNLLKSRNIQLFQKNKLFILHALIIFLFQYLNYLKRINAKAFTGQDLIIILTEAFDYMRKLFGLSHSRVLSRLGASQITPVNAEELLKKNEIHSSTEAILHRLPRQQLRQILKAICPVNSLEQNNAYDIIASAKRLRNHVNFKEEKICYKCPFVSKCLQAKKPWKQEKFEHPAKDLLVYYSELNNYLQPQMIRQRQWIAAYKLADSIITALDDLARGGKQTEEHEIHRLASIKVFEERTASKLLAQEQKDIKKSKQQQIFEMETKNRNTNVEGNPQIFGRDFSYDDYDDTTQSQKIQESSNKSKIQKKSKNSVEFEKPIPKINPTKTKKWNQKINIEQPFSRSSQKEEKIYKQFQREDENDRLQSSIEKKRTSIKHKKPSQRNDKSIEREEDQFIMEDNQFRLKGGKIRKGQNNSIRTQSEYQSTNSRKNEQSSRPIQQSVQARHRTKTR